MERKILIIYHDWANTAGNHAGMAYFVHQLKLNSEHQIKLIKTPKTYLKWPAKFKRLWWWYIRQKAQLFLKKKDAICFLEYLGGRQAGDHREIALKLKTKTAFRKIGMLHLPLSHLEKIYTDDYIKEGLEALDQVVVFGRQLQKNILERVPAIKVTYTPHYVETSYYKPLKRAINNQPIRCIVIGSIQRDFEKLKSIIEACPNVAFDICIGRRPELQVKFAELKNVKCHAYMAEAELLVLMQTSDISLSVLEDCVGNNVIVASMACGLPQIVSKVGSITDYLDDEIASLCENNQDFIEAINTLAASGEKRIEMGKKARMRSEKINLQASIKLFDKIFAE